MYNIFYASGDFKFMVAGSKCLSLEALHSPSKLGITKNKGIIVTLILSRIIKNKSNLRVIN